MLLAREVAASVLSFCWSPSALWGRDSIGENNTQEPSGELSGGQWQRITAGRGFYRDAELLVMDEPSSALHPRAEHALFQSIRSRQGTRTTILITHRLANIVDADRIFVLHDGVLEEQGTHAELITAGGRYATLYALQAAGYQPREAPSSQPAAVDADQA